MSVIIRLQNLPWSANAVDIREYFKGLNIPEGGVHIVGGDEGDAFIAFSTDEDARLAMRKTGGMLKGIQISLLLSSRAEMLKVIETARQQAMSLQNLMTQTPATPSTQTPPQPYSAQLNQTPTGGSGSSSLGGMGNNRMFGQTTPGGHIFDSHSSATSQANLYSHNPPAQVPMQQPPSQEKSMFPPNINPSMLLQFQEQLKQQKPPTQPFSSTIGNTPPSLSNFGTPKSSDYTLPSMGAVPPVSRPFDQMYSGTNVPLQKPSQFMMPTNEPPGHMTSGFNQLKQSLSKDANQGNVIPQSGNLGSSSMKTGYGTDSGYPHLNKSLTEAINMLGSKDQSSLNKTKDDLSFNKSSQSEIKSSSISKPNTSQAVSSDRDKSDRNSKAKDTKEKDGRRRRSRSRTRSRSRDRDRRRRYRSRSRSRSRDRGMRRRRSRSRDRDRYDRSDKSRDRDKYKSSNRDRGSGRNSRDRVDNFEKGRLDSAKHSQDKKGLSDSLNTPSSNLPPSILSKKSQSSLSMNPSPPSNRFVSSDITKQSISDSRFVEKKDSKEHEPTNWSESDTKWKDEVSKWIESKREMTDESSLNSSKNTSIQPINPWIAQNKPMPPSTQTPYSALNAENLPATALKVSNPLLAGLNVANPPMSGMNVANPPVRVNTKFGSELNTVWNRQSNPDVINNKNVIPGLNINESKPHNEIAPSKKPLLGTPANQPFFDLQTDPIDSDGDDSFNEDIEYQKLNKLMEEVDSEKDPHKNAKFDDSKNVNWQCSFPDARNSGDYGTNKDRGQDWSFRGQRGRGHGLGGPTMFDSRQEKPHADEYYRDSSEARGGTQQKDSREDRSIRNSSEKMPYNDFRDRRSNMDSRTEGPFSNPGRDDMPPMDPWSRRLPTEMRDERTSRDRRDDKSSMDPRGERSTMSPKDERPPIDSRDRKPLLDQRDGRSLMDERDGRGFLGPQDSRPLMDSKDHFSGRPSMNTRDERLDPRDQRPPLGDPRDGRPPFGDPRDGRPPLGDPRDGRPPLGDLRDGRPPFNDPRDGRPPLGDLRDGRSPYGDSRDGRPPFGDPRDGRSPFGDPRDGRPLMNPRDGRPLMDNMNNEGRPPMNFRDGRPPFESRDFRPPLDYRDNRTNYDSLDSWNNPMFNEDDRMRSDTSMFEDYQSQDPSFRGRGRGRGVGRDMRGRGRGRGRGGKMWEGGPEMDEEGNNEMRNDAFQTNDENIDARPKQTDRSERKQKYTHSVEVLNLPVRISYKQIRQMFPMIRFPQFSIKITEDTRGNLNAVRAVIKFNATSDAYVAVSQSGAYFNDRKVMVRYINDEIFDNEINIRQNKENPLPNSQMTVPPPAGQPPNIHPGQANDSFNKRADVPSTCVRVSNLPLDFDEKNMAHLFGQFIIIDIIIDRFEGKGVSNGNGFVQLKTADSVTVACTQINKSVVGDKCINVEPFPLEIFRRVAEQNQPYIPGNMAQQPPPTDNHESPNKRQKTTNEPQPSETTLNDIASNLTEEDSGQSINICKRATMLPVMHNDKLIQNNSTGQSKDKDNSKSSKFSEESNKQKQLAKSVTLVRPPLSKEESKVPADKNSKSPVKGELLTDSVEMRDVPLSATEADIRDFFSDEGLVPERVVFNTVIGKKRSVYIIFPRIPDASQATGKSNQKLGPGTVTIHLVAKPVVMKVLGEPFNPLSLINKKDEESSSPSKLLSASASQLQSPVENSTKTPIKQQLNKSADKGNNINSRGPKPAGPTKQTQRFGEPGCVINLKNVPKNATTHDILRFFGPFPYLKPSNIFRRYDDYNQPTTDARVSFNNSADAGRAISTLNGKLMLDKNIYLSLVE